MKRNQSSNGRKSLTTQELKARDKIYTPFLDSPLELGSLAWSLHLCLQITKKNLQRVKVRSKFKEMERKMKELIREVKRIAGIFGQHFLLFLDYLDLV